MKNSTKAKLTAKQFFAGGMAAMALLATGCPQPSGPDNPPEVPQSRDKNITLTFGEDSYTAKVEGTLLSAEWDGAPGKIETAIHGAFANAPGGASGETYKDRFKDAFSRNVTIILVKSPAEGYETYMLIGDKTTLYLNIASLDNDLAATFKTVVPKLNGGVTEMAKAPVDAKAFADAVIAQIPQSHAWCQAPQNPGVPLHLTTPYIAHTQRC